MKLYREFTSQEDLDREYNIELAAGDMRPYVEWFVGGSAKARAELECVLDVPFGPTRDETLDIFPAATPSAPVLLFVHGGYWRILSSKEFSLVARGPQARGVTVVVSNYSLCPKVTIAEITRQSRAAASLCSLECDCGFVDRSVCPLACSFLDRLIDVPTPSKSDPGKYGGSTTEITRTSLSAGRRRPAPASTAASLWPEPSIAKSILMTLSCVVLR